MKLNINLFARKPKMLAHTDVVRYQGREYEVAKVTSENRTVWVDLRDIDSNRVKHVPHDVVMLGIGS